MTKKFKLAMIMLMVLENCFADPDKEGREFAEILQKKPLIEQQKTLDKLRHHSGSSAYEAQTSALESLFDAEGDVGKKGEDPLKSSLGKKNIEAARQKHPYLPNLSETENLLKQKHRFKISHSDPVFKRHQEISKIEMGDKEGLLPKSQLLVVSTSLSRNGIVTCRQSIKPELKSCIKRLVLQFIPQPSITKTVTTYITVNREVYVERNNEYCGGGNSYTIQERIPRLTQVTVPQPPLLKERWEGCEDLERWATEGSCEKVAVEPQQLDETRTFPEYPDPIKKPNWSEQQSFICGAGKEIDECETLIKQGCEQIDSKCTVLKDGVCVEFENTFNCGTPGYLKGEGLVFDPSTGAFTKTKAESVIGYESQDFGQAATHFSALTEMGKKLQDELGGISGDPSNPTVFHGKCGQCRVNLGSFFRDCCKLKGILQGLLGGCNDEERKLAVAAIRNKRCVKIEGRYCHKKKLGICLEKRDSYCCYGSQLARIIQEIAHQQLGISWGDAKHPNCTSLTAEQLSRLNFDTPYAQSKLSEILAEVQSTAQEKFERVQQAVGSVNVPEKMDALEKKQQAEFEKSHTGIK